MKAVVLAAGEGMRLRPLTVSEPKVMIPIANSPILEYVIDSLVKNDVRDIVMVVGYRKERIMSHFEDGKKFGAKMEYVVQEKQLGNGHALLCAKDRLSGEFLVLPGDNVIDRRAVGDLLRAGTGPSALVVESENPSKYGVVTLEKGAIKGVFEKPQEMISNIILTGMYSLSDKIFQFIEQCIAYGEYGLSNAVQASLGLQPVTPVFSDGLWIDAVYPWDLLELNAAALENLSVRTAGKIEPQVVMSGPIGIGEETIIHAGTTIYGPVLIGDGCEIGPNVTIFPSTSIGNSVTIEPFTMVKNSILMSNCNIGAHSYLSHCVLGYGVKSRSHMMAPGAEAYVNIADEFYKVPHIGSIVGEDTNFGTGVAIEPGTIVGAGCKVSSGARIIRNLPNRALVT
ncbi:MAG: bifunctional sugar-1-phosphate nucleotidylyltransferase/acetyltransferase [Thermoplasmatota archaeon]|nr:NTP transferase domain-containing protein [Candidatus Thermoplasmatota archaeon]MBU1914388.1 NTP transferase domain-containing protein [Candidatus Thermoplasmatota archaeon]